jgi:hypothetical protein
LRAALASLVFVLCCFGVSSVSFAQEMRTVDGFYWQRQKSTGDETAASRSDSSINFLDVGGLSNYSTYLVQETLGSISDAAGKKVDRSLKNAAIIIVHDTDVFSRLKSDRNAFSVLGIPDSFIDELQKKAKAANSARVIARALLKKCPNFAIFAFPNWETPSDCLERP